MADMRRNQDAVGSKLSPLFHAGFLLRLLFNPEDGGGMSLRNTVLLSPDYTLYPKGRNSSNAKTVP
jgi:hypothetical protein